MPRDFSPEILDQLLAGGLRPEDLTAEEGLFRRLKKALLERALGAELTHHVGYEKGEPAGRGTGNSRNGVSRKTLLTEDGEMAIEVPRDRAGPFEPQIVAKGQTHFEGFDEKIVSLYARGLSVREIQGYLAELYGTEVSPDLISKVTDAVLDEVRDWQSRPLETIYPIVFFDALRVKIRDEGLVKNKAVYVVLGIKPSGEKEVLGLWIEQTEGAKFWLKVMNDLKNRGVGDILIAVVDGLKGFPEAIGSVFPQTLVQTCIVHLIRNSLSFVSWKDRKTIMPSMKAIYHAENADAALQRLEEFETEWGKRYPAIGQAWRRAWQHVTPFFASEIRKMIYTTNAVEALNRSLRKIIKTRGSFPTDEAAMKLLYLAIRNAGVHWRRPIAWTAAMSQFAIQFGDRNHNHRGRSYTKLLTLPPRPARRQTRCLDAHEGIKAAVAKVLCATWQRCRVHFMRNALAHAGKSGRRVVSAFIGTAFAQETAEAASTQWRAVADQIRPKVPKLATIMDQAEPDVLAYMSFPKEHRTKLHSTNPIERLNGEIKRRTDVVGIFPNEEAISRLVGALLLEQNDEWAVQRGRYMTLETIANLSDDPFVRLPAVAA